MEREKVIELAQEAGFRPMRESQKEDPGYSVSSLQRLVRLVEQEALERVARVCIDKAMKMENEASLADTEDDAISLRSSAWLITVCGDAIRNLKDNHDKE